MIYLLVPSYNDSQNFELLLKNISKAIKGKKYKVIIVDDGSTDDTEHIINTLSRKYQLFRIGYKNNRGPGYAFKFGFNYLIPKLKNKDIVVTMEADNSSDFSIMEKMIYQLKNFDIVLSSPFARGGKLIGLDNNRKILSDISRRLDSVIFRISGVETYGSFYRAYRAEILIKASKSYKSSLIIENGFSAMVELLIKLSNLNASICEIPSVLDWRKRQGKSKMKVGKTIIRHLAIYKNYFLGRYNL